MLSTGTLAFAGAFLALIVVALLSLRLRNVENQVSQALIHLAANNKRSIGLKKMAEVEASLTELTDAYDALLTSHKKLRSRIGMRANRDAKQQDKQNEIPDPRDDPAGYKREMRLKLMRK